MKRRQWTYTFSEQYSQYKYIPFYCKNRLRLIIFYLSNSLQRGLMGGVRSRYPEQVFLKNLGTVTRSADYTLPASRLVIVLATRHLKNIYSIFTWNIVFFHLFIWNLNSRGCFIAITSHARHWIPFSGLFPKHSRETQLKTTIL